MHNGKQNKQGFPGNKYCSPVDRLAQQVLSENRGKELVLSAAYIPVTIEFQLMEKDRFAVDGQGSHKEVLKLFQTIPGNKFGNFCFENS